ncbi:MAG: mechanosensitive ion channel family protein [Clostridium sp.]|uniref:mechanosensitive ion channel family protein n=1 Tax=Clostridium sp. TaxID=1506 RepID=UPI002FC896FC
MDIRGMIKEFLIDNDQIIDVIFTIGNIILIFILAKITTKIVNKLIEKFFKNQSKLGIQTSEQKKKTLTELLKNITMYVVYFVAIIWALQVMGVPPSTIVAVAGAGSVAIGLGAQNVIKDIISGFFILFEDQFAVGDYITIDMMSGVVEVVGLRITKIRDFSGDLHIIPNGSIVTVTNKSRGDMRALVDVQVSYNENLDRVLDIIKGVLDGIKKDCNYFTEGPNIYGVVSITETVVTIRILARTEPMKQWEAEVEIRRRIKESFDLEGVQMPYQKMVYVNEKE